MIQQTLYRKTKKRKRSEAHEKAEMAILPKNKNNKRHLTSHKIQKG